MLKAAAEKVCVMVIHVYYAYVLAPEYCINVMRYAHALYVSIPVYIFNFTSTFSTKLIPFTPAILGLVEREECCQGGHDLLQKGWVRSHG